MKFVSLVFLAFFTSTVFAGGDYYTDLATPEERIAIDRENQELYRKKITEDSGIVISSFKGPGVKPPVIKRESVKINSSSFASKEMGVKPPVISKNMVNNAPVFTNNEMKMQGNQNYVQNQSTLVQTNSAQAIQTQNYSLKKDYDVSDLTLEKKEEMGKRIQDLEYQKSIEKHENEMMEIKIQRLKLEKELRELNAPVENSINPQVMRERLKLQKMQSDIAIERRKMREKESRRNIIDIKILSITGSPDDIENMRAEVKLNGIYMNSIMTGDNLPGVNWSVVQIKPTSVVVLNQQTNQQRTFRLERMVY